MKSYNLSTRKPLHHLPVTLADGTTHYVAKLIHNVAADTAINTESLPALLHYFSCWPIFLLANHVAQVDEAVMRPARVGIESVLGYVENGLSSSNQASLEIAQSSLDTA